MYTKISYVYYKCVETDKPAKTNLKRLNDYSRYEPLGGPQASFFLCAVF